MPYSTGTLSLTTATPGVDFITLAGDALVGAGFVFVHTITNSPNVYRVYRCPAAVSGAGSDFFLVLGAQGSPAGARTQAVWAAVCEGYSTSAGMTRYVPARPALNTTGGVHFNRTTYPLNPDGTVNGAAYGLPSTQPYGVSSAQNGQVNATGSPAITTTTAMAAFTLLGTAAPGGAWVLSVTGQRLVTGLRTPSGVESGGYLGLLESYVASSVDPLPLFQGRLQALSPVPGAAEQTSYWEHQYNGVTREPYFTSTLTLSGANVGLAAPNTVDQPYEYVLLLAGAHLNTNPMLNVGLFAPGASAGEDFFQGGQPTAARVEAHSLVRAFTRGSRAVTSPQEGPFSARRGALRDVVGFAPSAVTGVLLGDTFTYTQGGVTRTYAKIGHTTDSYFVDTGV